MASGARRNGNEEGKPEKERARRKVALLPVLTGGMSDPEGLPLGSTQVPRRICLQDATRARKKQQPMGRDGHRAALYHAQTRQQVEVGSP